MIMSEFQKKRAEELAEDHQNRFGSENSIWQKEDFIAGYAAACADAQVLVEALEYAAGAMKNEMVCHGLPLEWSPSSGIGVAEEALKKWRGE